MTETTSGVSGGVSIRLGFGGRLDFSHNRKEVGSMPVSIRLGFGGRLDAGYALGKWLDSLGFQSGSDLVVGWPLLAADARSSLVSIRLGFGGRLDDIFVIAAGLGAGGFNPARIWWSAGLADDWNYDLVYGVSIRLGFGGRLDLRERHLHDVGFNPARIWWSAGRTYSEVPWLISVGVGGWGLGVA